MRFLELGRAMINSDSRSIFQELAEEGKKLHRAHISECKSKSKEIERESVCQYPKEEEGPEDKTDFSELSSPRHLCPHVLKQRYLQLQVGVEGLPSDLTQDVGIPEDFEQMMTMDEFESLTY